MTVFGISSHHCLVSTAVAATFRQRERLKTPWEKDILVEVLKLCFWSCPLCPYEYDSPCCKIHRAPVLAEELSTTALERFQLSIIVSSVTCVIFVRYLPLRTYTLESLKTSKNKETKNSEVKIIEIRTQLRKKRVQELTLDSVLHIWLIRDQRNEL